MTAETNDLPVWKEQTYTLIFPIGDMKTLTFREPNGEALEAMEDLAIPEGAKPTIKQTIAIISILSGVDTATIKKFNQRDILGAGEAMVPLLSEEPDQNATDI